MSFERALQENRPPRSVGDVTLLYESPVLVGESRPRPARMRLLPELLFVAALGLGLSAVALLVTGSADGVGAPAGLALGAMFLVVLAARADRGVRQRRRFVLHFADETLRLDLPGDLRRRGHSLRLSFDDVRDVYVLERHDGRFSLVVEVQHEGEASKPALLVDEVQPSETEELKRLWLTLRAAFGIRPAATPPPEP